MRDSRHRPVKFRRLPCRPPRALENRDDFRRRLSGRLAQLLLVTLMSIEVFRAALFSIVLTLAIGQSAGLLCTFWCHDATPAGCPHYESTTSPSMRAAELCTNVTVAAVAFVGEDGRRTTPAPDGQNTFEVLRFRFFGPPSDPRHGYEPGRRLLLEERPLAIALRI